MPTYVYTCKTGHTTELAHRFTEIVGAWCPECGGRMHRRPQLVTALIPPVDAGLRRTMEIHSYLKGKYHANKERREANDAAYRHAREGNRGAGA